jgi:hypothetical protein
MKRLFFQLQELLKKKAIVESDRQKLKSVIQVHKLALI